MKRRVWLVFGVTVLLLRLGFCQALQATIAFVDGQLEAHGIAYGGQ